MLYILGRLQKQISQEKRELIDKMFKEKKASIMNIPRVVKIEDQNSYINNAPDMNKLRNYEPQKDNATEAVLKVFFVLFLNFIST